MRVMVLGLRGFPSVQGGVETHAEHLYPLLVQLGCRVDVIVRTPYMPKNIQSWKGIRFRRLWAPRHKTLEVVLHTFLGILYAGVSRPDLLHIHAIGPALLTPLARLLGLRVVVTHHGPDYDREKWGAAASYVLRIGELMGMKFSSQRIVVSQVIQKLVKEKYNCGSVVIPNGVVLPKIPSSKGALARFSLQQKRYVLFVSRLVPEKRHLDLIEAFVTANISGWKLVLVGDTDHPDKYSKAILSKADNTPNVVSTGFQSGLALQELYANAGLFVLPSSHEGLPIALLEALSYGLPVIASNIPPNLEIGLSDDHYFPLGDIKSLSIRLEKYAKEAVVLGGRCTETRSWVEEKYSWEEIARKSIEIYKETLYS